MSTTESTLRRGKTNSSTPSLYLSFGSFREQPSQFHLCGRFKALEEYNIQKVLEGCRYFNTIAHGRRFEPIDVSSGDERYGISVI